MQFVCMLLQMSFGLHGSRPTPVQRARQSVLYGSVGGIHQLHAVPFNASVNCLFLGPDLVFLPQTCLLYVPLNTAHDRTMRVPGI